MNEEIIPTEELAKQYIGLKLFSEDSHIVIGEILDAKVKGDKIEITGILNDEEIIAWI